MGAIILRSPVSPGDSWGSGTADPNILDNSAFPAESLGSLWMSSEGDMHF